MPERLAKPATIRMHGGGVTNAGGRPLTASVERPTLGPFASAGPVFRLTELNTAPDKYSPPKESGIIQPKESGIIQMVTDADRARAVLAHANDQLAYFASEYRARRYVNRGAWAGSDRYGAEPRNYVPTSSAVVRALGRLLSGGWWLDTSFSGDLSIKKVVTRGRRDRRQEITFIYHL